MLSQEVVDQIIQTLLGPLLRSKTIKKEVRSVDKPNYKVIEKLLESGVAKEGLLARLVYGARRTGDWSDVANYLTENPELVSQAEEILFAEEMSKRENPYYPFPSNEELAERRGDIELGLVNFNQGIFSFPHDNLAKHVMVMGRSGTGKTTLNRGIARQTAKIAGVNVVIPDFKQDYRNLINDGFKVILFDKFRFNPLQVPTWMDPSAFINLWARVFCAEHFLGLPGEGLFFQALKALFRERDVISGSQNYPTMKDLFTQVMGMRRRSDLGMRYRDVYQALDVRLMPYVEQPQNFGFNHGIEHDVFVRESVVWELPGDDLNDYMRNFLVSLIINMSYARNMEMGLRGDRLRTLFLIDEAATWMGANRESSGLDWIEPSVNGIARKGREFGIGLWVCSQETKSFNQRYPKQFTLLKIAFPLSSGEDVWEVQKSFGLDKEQKDFLSKLPEKGFAVVSYGGFDRPFLLEVRK